MATVEQGTFRIPWNWPEVAGVFVGGCVERGVGSSFRHQGHAHTSRKDAHHGWICVRSIRRVITDSGKPTTLMLHEYAHIITGQGHTARWAKVLSNLGAPAEAKRCRARYSNRHRHIWSAWERHPQNDRDLHRCTTCKLAEVRFDWQVAASD